MLLAQLSTELLQLIASHLSQVDLLNVSLTSTHLRAATEPALYREFCPPCLRRRPMSYFIKALLKDPKRLRYVRNLRLPVWETIDPVDEANIFWSDSVQQMALTERKRIYCSMTSDWDPYKLLGQCLSQEDYELFTSTAVAFGYLKDATPYDKCALELRSVEKSYDAYGGKLFYWYYLSTADLESLPFDEKFCHLLKAGVDEAFMMLLMSLLTTLRCLSLPYVPARRIALPWARALQRYSKLREFTAIPESYYSIEYCPLSFWVDILTLPTLQVFTAHGCASGWVQPDQVVMRSPCTWVSESLSITRLVLENSDFLEDDDLKLMLGRCRNLKTFRYSTKRCRKATIPSKRIIELLAPFQTTLEEVFLDNNSNAYRHGLNLADGFIDQPLSSLVQFSRLERLWLPTHMFGHLPVAWEQCRGLAASTFAGILPPSLKELKVFDSHTYPLLTQPALDFLIENASADLPELTTLEVVSSHDHSKEDLKISEEEREIRRDSGTTFTFAFRWSKFENFKLPRTGEEAKRYSRAGSEYTCWDGDRYATKTWEALQVSNILTKDEAEENGLEEVLATEAERDDAPTCNSMIVELLEKEFDEMAATGLQSVGDA